MASISGRMTVKQDRRYFLIWYTAAKDPIDTNFEEEWVLPKVVLNISSELLSLLVCLIGREDTCCEKICKICIPRRLLDRATGLSVN